MLTRARYYGERRFEPHTPGPKHVKPSGVTGSFGMVQVPPGAGWSTCERASAAFGVLREPHYPRVGVALGIRGARPSGIDVPPAA